ncbi:MAG: hypothetical protein GX452_13755 [Ignavibacteriales bacterium]|nr:hypothetical protein [Ignavibacteriales bacterium]
MVTINELKRFLGVDVSDTSQDTLYTELITRAEQKIANLFGGELYLTNHTDEKHDFSKILLTKHYPIVSVEKLTVDGETLTEDEDFFVYDKYIEFYGIYSTGRKSVAISYTAGFGDIPDDIDQAIILTAANFLKINVDLQPQQFEDTRLTREIIEILTPYLRINL